METLLLGQPYLPTDATLRPNWMVYPLGEESWLHIGAIFGAIVPACLVSLTPTPTIVAQECCGHHKYLCPFLPQVNLFSSSSPLPLPQQATSLIFIEHQLTIIAVTGPHFKLKRGVATTGTSS